MSKDRRNKAPKHSRKTKKAKTAHAPRTAIPPAPEPDTPIAMPGRHAGQKIYILDTSAAVEEPECVLELAKDGNIVVIPRQVIHELDGLKFKYKRGSDTYEAAKAANRLIFDCLPHVNTNLEEVLAGDAQLSDCRMLRNRGYLFWEARHADTSRFHEKDIGDNVILATAIYVKERAREARVSLISEDRNLIIKAYAENMGLEAETLRMGKVELKEGHYKGYCKAFVDAAVLQEFMQSGPPDQRSINLRRLADANIPGKKKRKFYWNEGVILTDKDDNNRYVLTKVRYDNEGQGTLVNLRYAASWSERKEEYCAVSVHGFRPGDPLQTFALEFLLDPEVCLTVIDGKAGTGKTRLMVTASVALLTSIGTFGEKLQEALKTTTQNLDVPHTYFNGLMLCRPEYSSSDFDLAAVPGSMEEKIAPWLIPYFQAMVRLKKVMNTDPYERLKREDKIRTIPTSQLRGINIEDAIGLFDEVQNGTRPFAKTLMSRFGERSKGIISGDITQIDNPYVGPRNNALTLIREQYKGKGPEIAMVTLERNYRGKISKLAEEL